MDKARALVPADAPKGCAAGAAAQTALARIDSDLAALLPAQPNERIVYRCTKGRLEPRDPR